MRVFNKVFEVGLPKTGTTSLGGAFRILGLKTIGWSPRVHYAYTKGGDPLPAMRLAREYEAFEDGPWHNLPMEMLDAAFPGSRFILLERDDHSWYESMCHHYADPEHAWFHNKDEQQWIAEKHDKYRRIRDYFSDRPNDLLVMNIVDDGDGWDVLCPFLGLNRPNEPFPWLNSRTSRRAQSSGDMTSAPSLNRRTDTDHE